MKSNIKITIINKTITKMTPALDSQLLVLAAMPDPTHLSEI